MLDKLITETLNVMPDDLRTRLENDGKSNELHHATFRRIAANLSLHIEDNATKNIPTLNFIVGPTGSGKSAFSKGLFTVCLHDFWSHNIVPSRVEYTRYTSDFGVSPLDPPLNDKIFSSFLRRCQFRDLMIFFFLSDRLTMTDRRRCISSLSASPAARQQLMELLNATINIAFDGDVVRLDPPLRGLFQKHWHSIEEADRDEILYQLSEQLSVRFLVSFDGFDTTRIEHFMFDSRAPNPVHYLVRLLKGLHEKKIFAQDLFKKPIEIHCIAYLRDSTYERLRTQISRDTGGELDYLRYWIVPPKYELLAHRSCRFICNTLAPLLPHEQHIADDIKQMFHLAIFENTELPSKDDITFTFGSSARRMKSHIKHTLLSAIQNSAPDHEPYFTRTMAGLDPKSLITLIADSHLIREMPFYSILEDLFLNDTRQLIPKYEVDSFNVTQALAANDIERAITCIVDVDEISAMFGCNLNYFFEAYVTDGANKCPALLVMIRILQFIDLHPRTTFVAIQSFLREIGYSCNETMTKFSLYTLLRAELVCWDGSRGTRRIEDVPYYITTTGVLAYKRLLCSITYVSEAIISSLIFDDSLSKLLIDREPDPAIWIADCINNASIAIFIISEIEKLESQIAKKNHVEFEKYLLYDKLFRALDAEAGHTKIEDSSTVVRSR